MRSTLAVLALFAVAMPARAETFAPIPAEQTGGVASGLEIRIVGYSGSTNGEITVDVRNPGKDPTPFAAKGLYFVPQVHADKAPQRLGAVGPFQQQTAKGWTRTEELKVAPGATERLKLDVYCIDSHRASPTSSTPFRVAKDRIPVPLADAIDREAKANSAAHGGVSAPAAKSTVQSTVWKNRNSKWIALDGESAQEQRAGDAGREERNVRSRRR